VTKLTDEQIEELAIRCAKGNNGGEWATHYTEDQKNFWRGFVRGLEDSILERITNNNCAAS
jgi:hypothetical protein